MAVICMATYGTEANSKAWMQAATLASMAETVDWSKHWLIVVDNASSKPTKDLLECYQRKLYGRMIVLHNQSNLGTARAISRAWDTCEKDAYCMKVDDDVVWHQSGWVDRMQDALERDPNLGIIGLKRNDLAENPWAPEGCWSRSDLVMLPHKPGERWVVIEVAQHVMGTCQMYQPKFRALTGHLYQPSCYSYDDSIMAARVHGAGYHSAFLVNFTIDHIDGGGGTYQKFKEGQAGAYGEIARKCSGMFRLGLFDLWTDADCSPPTLSEKGKQELKPILDLGVTDTIAMLNYLDFVRENGVDKVVVKI